MLDPGGGGAPKRKRRPTTSSINAILGGAGVAASQAAAAAPASQSAAAASAASAAYGPSGVSGAAAAAVSNALSSAAQAQAKAAARAAQAAQAAAARRQAALIQTYVTDRETRRLENKHYEFDAQDRVIKRNATTQQIHDDLQTAQRRVERQTVKLATAPQVTKANSHGEVLNRRKIAALDRRIRKAPQEAVVPAVTAAVSSLAHGGTEEQARRRGKGVIKAMSQGYTASEAPEVAARRASRTERGYQGPKAKQQVDARASGITDAEDEYFEFMRNLGVTYKPEMDYTEKKVREELHDLAPGGVNLIRGLVGDEPGALTPTLGELGSVGLTAGAALAGPALGAAKGAKALAALDNAVATQRLEAMAARGLTGTDDAARGLERITAGLKGHYAPTARALRGAQRQVTKASRRYPTIGQPALPRALTEVEAAAGLVRGPGHQAATFPLLPLAATSGPGKTFIQGTEQALTDDLAQTLKTTGRAVYSFPAAVVADAADLATGHFREFAESQIEYAKTLAPLFGDDVNAAARAISEDVGLIPHLTAALGGVAIGKTARRAAGRPAISLTDLPSISQARVKRNVRLATEGATPEIRNKAKEFLALNKDSEPMLRARQEAKREAERASVSAEQETGRLVLEMRGGKHGRRLESDLRKLDEREVAEGLTQGDLVQAIARHGFKKGEADVGDIRAVLERLRDPRREIDPDTAHTRKVLTALIEHPEIIRDPTVRKVVGRLQKLMEDRAIERHSERTGKRQTTPDPMDETPRLAHVASEGNILLPHERMLLELDGSTKVKPRRGQDFAKAVRGQARNLIKRAKRLEAQAASQRRMRPERAAVLEGRAKRYRAEAERQLAVVDRWKEAVRLEAKAAQIEKGNRAGAAQLRTKAEALRATAAHADEQRHGSFIEETNRFLETKGRDQPVFMSERDVTRPEHYSATGAQARRTTKKEKFRKGTLAEEGRINESVEIMLENIYRGRSSITERARQRGFLDEAPLRSQDYGRFLTNDEISEIRRAGEVPAGYISARIAEFSPAIQRNAALRQEVEAKRIAAKATQKGDAELHILVPKKQFEEFKAQEESLQGRLRSVRIATRAQAILMLAASTTWAQMQLIATPVSILVRNPNPVAHARAMRKGWDIWQKMPPEERTDLWAHFGGNPADFIALGDNVRGSTMNQAVALSQHNAMKAAFKSPIGRMVQAIGNHAKKGGPLIIFNRHYEAQWRKYEALLEMDRLSGVSATGRTRAFAVATSSLTTTLYKHLEHMKGLDTPDQIRAYLDNPRLMRDLEKEVNDSYGNWAAMTEAERRLASVVVFYPFLRFSLSWIAKFPAKNPLKTAVYLNLAQQNAQELSLLLGGDPSFWNGWAMAVHHVHGEPGLLDLARALPGGNAIMEGVAGGMNPVEIGAHLVNPLFGSTLAAGFGKDMFGRDLPEGMSLLEAIGKNALNLSPLTRPFAPMVGPEPGPWSKLYKAIEDRSVVKRMFLADLTPGIDTERQLAELGRLIDTVMEKPTDDELLAAPAGTPERVALRARKAAAEKASKEIDGLLRQHEVQTKKEQKAEDQQYSRRVYGDFGKDEKRGSGALYTTSSSADYKEESYKSSSAGDTYKGGGKDKTEKEPVPDPGRLLGKYIAQNLDVPEDNGPPGQKRDEVVARNNDPKAKVKPVASINALLHPAKGEDPKIKGAEEKKVAKALTRAVEKTKGGAQLEGPLTPGQKTFGAELAKLTGIDPQVIGAWMLKEQSWDYAEGYEQANYHNWLNIQPVQVGGSQAIDSHDPQFSDPVEAARYTYEWMQSNPNTPGGGAADELAAQIKAVPSAGDANAQAAAIASSIWGTGDISGTMPLVSATEAKAKPIPKALKQKAQSLLGTRTTQDIIQAARHPEAAVPQTAGTTVLKDLKPQYEGTNVKPPPYKKLTRLVQNSQDNATIAAQLHVPESQAKIQLTGLVPKLQLALMDLARDTGVPVVVNEGFRTAQRQIDLASGTGGATGPAAAPGTSNHEHGLAVDVANDGAYSDEALAAAGLFRAVAGESWHFELSDPDGTTAAIGGGTSTNTTSAPVSGSTGAPVTTSGAPPSTTPAIPGMEAPTRSKKGGRTGTLPPSLFSPTRTATDKLTALEGVRPTGGIPGFDYTPAGVSTTDLPAVVEAARTIASTRKRLLRR